LQQTFDDQWLEDFDPALMKEAIASFERDWAIRTEYTKLYTGCSGNWGFRDRIPG
jgi:hypothetical protein